MSALETLIHVTEQSDPDDRHRLLRGIWQALTEEEAVPLSDLYGLAHDDFNLVLDALWEWRLQRYVYADTAARRTLLGAGAHHHDPLGGRLARA